MIAGLIISVLVNVALAIYVISIVKKQSYGLQTKEQISNQIAQELQIKREESLRAIEDENKQTIEFLAEQRQLLFQSYLKDLAETKQRNQELIQQQYDLDLAESRQKLENEISLLRDSLKAEIVALLNRYDLAEENMDELEADIEDCAAKQRAIIEQLKQEEEKKQSANFYRLCLLEHDASDIYWLRQIESKLHNTEALNKIIYKVYYEKPLTALVGRVVGTAGIRCGIYKITNIENGMCYVGQSVNIAERWKQHLKRALGCEPMTQNKLYPVMHDVGPENFTWQIIEDCPKDKLNEREKYWQTFYGAQEFGYSIK